MEYRHLGRSGIRVSALSLGSWVTFHKQVDVDKAVEMMAAAYDAGVNFFDNAEAYAKGKSEEVMGAALKKLGWRRSSYLVSTKLYWGINEGINEKNTLNRKYLLEAMDGSLKRFGLDHVDLVYCHRPDPETPIEETVWAMHNIVNSGKAMYWGSSEWSAMEIIAAIEIAERHHLHKPVMEQPEYNLLHRERFEVEYARLFKDYGYGTTTWSPLASGLLTGKYNNGVPEGSRATLENYDWLIEKVTNQDALNKVKKLGKVADELGVSLAQMSIAWLLKNPNVSTVITGASRVEQVRENLKAMDVVEKLTPDVMEKIEEVIK
ncbi:MAG: aldo/keto reductase [Pelolinea sp.]|nr:aldo/keto reductase [Pelolinea sp.]